MIGKSCKRKDSSCRLLVSVSVSLALKRSKRHIVDGMLWVVLCKKSGLSSHPAGFSPMSKYCWMGPHTHFYVFKAQEMFGVYISFVMFPRL